MRLLSASVFGSLLLLVSMVAPGCSTSPASGGAADSKPVLLSLTNVVILPTLRATDASAEAMRVAVRALEAAPSAATLTAAQVSWRAARKSWSRGDAFRFAVTDKSIADAIDFWPARPAAIEDVVKGSGPVTVAAIELLGSNARGFHGIEYILFDQAGGDAAVLEKLTTEPAAARRLSYVAAAAEHLRGKVAALLAAWDPAGGNFAREIREAGSGAVLFTSAKAAVDQLVNSSAVSLELVTATKIGRPYGTRTGGVVAPDQEQSAVSDNSLAEMLDTLEGARALYLGVYEGGQGRGLSELVRAKNPALDDRMGAAFESSRAAIAAIPPPFRTAIVAQRQAVEPAYKASRVLRDTMRTEVVQVLSVTLQINPIDGDN